MLKDRHVKKGDIVRVHFTGKFENDTVFDSSFGKEPLRFKVGNNEVIRGFDEAVIGMKEGFEKTVYLTSDKAYGIVEKELIIEINKSELPSNLSMKINQELLIPNDEGAPIKVRVTKTTDETITLDGNHPLAGKNLIFTIKLIEIQ
ncbi:MAG: peptidylprolyl isomerase [Ignavibacteriae bacterium]|nr:MAG: peptidylprolyl isomerase [Ignavibacteriota bacterium]